MNSQGTKFPRELQVEDLWQLKVLVFQSIANDPCGTLLQVSFDPEVMHVFDNFGLPTINPF